MRYIHINTILFLSILTILLPSCGKEQTPNILFIMSDDHTSQAWAVYGGLLENVVEAPNIKRLSNEGCLLQNVFCTNSICTPSRASILTGKYSHKNGVYTLSEGLHPDSVHFVKHIREKGYQTALIGKWHLKEKPSGFDYYNVLPGQGRYWNPVMKDSANWGIGGEEYIGFSTDVITNESLKWLKQRNKDKPFMLMTHFKATHEPFDYPERYQNLYENIQIPEPENLFDAQNNGNGRTFSGQNLEILGERWRQHTEKNSSLYPGLPFRVDDADSLVARKKIYQKFIKDFLRSAAAIDDNIGRILNFLDEEGLAENTVVVYTSDQGYFLGEHGFFDKRIFYEESARMPFVIRYPKEIQAGSINEDLILNIDFAALFLDYAGDEEENYYDGMSFRNNLNGETPDDWRQSMYYRYWLHQTNRPAHFGIRNQRYKLIFFYGLHLNMSGAHRENTYPAWEFYDLLSDPAENNNAIDDPRYQEIILDMKKELLKIRSEAGDEDMKYPELRTIINKHF